MPEQDKRDDMQTRQDLKLKAHGHNNPQLNQPQQVSILDGLMGEDASLSANMAAPASNTRHSQERPRHQLYCQSRLTLVIVNFYL